MATVTAIATPISDTTPVVVEVERELSGPQWCARYPGSNNIGDLESDFGKKVAKFKEAMEVAGINVRSSATYRPKERAYLMHYCVKVAKGQVKPDAVERLDGVLIEWDHGDIEKSKKAAQQMADKYGIVFPPAYPTRHSLRLAIDMTITNFVGKTVKDASGNDVEIKKEADLYPVGGSYGVNKLVPDHPHWSDNGQ